MTDCIILHKKQKITNKSKIITNRTESFLENVSYEYNNFTYICTYDIFSLQTMVTKNTE